MDIRETKISEIEILKGWFPDQESSYFWGGPGLRYPFTHESFIEDIRWNMMPSYSLLDDSGELIGFGQYYEKFGRCHLARLAISPNRRGNSHGKYFISRLMEIGKRDLAASGCSLFVLNYNERAIQCYRALGFKKVKCPPDESLHTGIDFMVLEAKRAEAG